MTGALAGLRVLELGGIGPGPFGAMILADHGADVVRIERAEGRSPFAPPTSLLDRGKRLVTLNLKDPDDAAIAHRLVARADIVIEGFRPGVAERLGFGPDACRAANPRLIYARMTGYGQEGPMAGQGGHDINYVAMAGALGYFGRPDGAPVPPLNLVGDFAGGGLTMAFGIVAALWERERSGEGQVIDAAMVDGVAVLMTLFHGDHVRLGARGTNDFDGSRPMYEVYETSDHQYMALGSTDAQFFARLLVGLGLDPAELPDEYDRDGWGRLRAAFTERFASRTQAEWREVFDRLDAAVTPVLDLEEAMAHPHAVARHSYVDGLGGRQPVPAPRLSRTAGVLRPATKPADPDWPGLDDWGVADDELVGRQEVTA